MSATQFSSKGVADLTHTLSDCVWNQAKGLEIVKTLEKGASLIPFLTVPHVVARNARGFCICVSGVDMLLSGVHYAWVPGEGVKALEKGSFS